MTGKVRASGDIAAQTRNIFQKIDLILKAAGATWDDVVKTMDYTTIWENYKATARSCWQFSAH